MKVAIGFKNINSNSAWGGGYQFAKNLKNFLENKDFKILNDLSEKNIDVILLTDIRPNSESSSFNHFDVEKYLLKNKNTKVVLRVNECDERKNTNYVNFSIKMASRICDHIVYPSKWLYNLFSDIDKPHTIIINGADKSIFNNYGKKYKDQNNRKLSIVTHHWSSHYNKGFKYYLFLDRILGEEPFKNYFSFTYIGNISKDYNFKNTNLVKPKHGYELGQELSKHDIYLTASINEPGGNHQIEGINCGLPVMYLNNAALAETCRGYGEEFYDFVSFKEKLLFLKKDYEKYYIKCQKYPFNSTYCCNQYYSLFVKLNTNKTILTDQNDKKEYNIIDKYIFNYLKYKIKFIAKLRAIFLKFL